MTRKHVGARVMKNFIATCHTKELVFTLEAIKDHGGILSRRICSYHPSEKNHLDCTMKDESEGDKDV